MTVKDFFDQPVKNKHGAYEKILKMSRNSDYTTRNLLDYLYHQKCHKRIGSDLSREKIQLFLNKLFLQENWKTKKQQRAILNFS